MNPLPIPAFYLFFQVMSATIPSMSQDSPKIGPMDERICRDIAQQFERVPNVVGIQCKKMITVKACGDIAHQNIGAICPVLEGEQ